MSEKKYLDKTGLEYLWSKLKETFANKTETFLYYTVATDYPTAETITFESLYNSLIEKFGTSSVILKSTGYFNATGFLIILYRGGYYDASFLDFTNHRIYNSEGLYLPGTTKISIIFEDAKDIATKDDLSSFITGAQTIVELTKDNIAEVKETITHNPGALIMFEDYIYAPTYKSETIPTFYSCFASDEETVRYLIITWEDGNIEYGYYQVLKDQIIAIDYTNLKHLRDSGLLIPGQQYRITDYVTTTIQENTQSAGHQFDVIVTADDENTLNENARAAMHEGDDYFTEQTEKLVSATWKEGVTLNSIVETYKLQDDIDAQYGVPGDDSYNLTEMSMRKNRNGINVPYLFDPDPEEEGYDVYYMYCGTYDWIVNVENPNLTVFYTLSEDNEIWYEGMGLTHDNDIIAAIGWDIDGTPLLYREDVYRYGLDNIPTDEYFSYEGDFVLEGVTYNKWSKVDESVFSPIYILTNIIVINGEFIISPEDFKNELIIETVSLDKWEECDVNNVFDSGYYLLTNRLVDADFEDSTRSLVNLAAWDLKYCLDNDTSRFAWADSTNGKGVIYYMKDEWGNECPYDFKNIQFIRCLNSDGALDLDNGTDTWCYTFGGKIDRSISQEGLNIYRSNIIKDRPQGINCGNNFLLPDNVFLGISECMTKNNVLGHSCYDNTFGDMCSFNTLGNGCYANTFSSGCYNNIFGDQCYHNTFGSGCNDNMFVYNCFYNTFGNNSSDNTFGNGCYSNTLGDQCYSNTLGDQCYHNTFGEFCKRNSFGHSCNYITFGTSVGTINCCKYNIIDSGCSFLYINSPDTNATDSNCLQNVHIHLGISGSSNSNRRIIRVPDRNLPYSIDYYAPGSKEIILNEEE